MIFLRYFIDNFTFYHFIDHPNMSIPSIIIPSDDLIIDKPFSTVYGNGPVMAPDTTPNRMFRWSSVVYEMWDEEEIYNDLSHNIDQLYEDFDCAEYHEDFSQKTMKELDAGRNRVVEGIKTLIILKSEKRKNLIHKMEVLLISGEKYVNKRLRIIKAMEMTEKLLNRIKQFRVDVEMMSMGFADAYPLHVEIDEIKKEINILEKMVASDKEIELAKKETKSAEEYLFDKTLEAYGCEEM